MTRRVAFELKEKMQSRSWSLLADELVFCVQGVVFVFGGPVGRGRGSRCFFSQIRTIESVHLFYFLRRLLTTAVGILSNSCSCSAWSACLLRSTQSQTAEKERTAMQLRARGKAPQQRLFFVFCTNGTRRRRTLKMEFKLKNKAHRTQISANLWIWIIQGWEQSGEDFKINIPGDFPWFDGVSPTLRWRSRSSGCGTGWGPGRKTVETR